MAHSSVIGATDNDRLCGCCKAVISVRCEDEYYPHHQSEAELEKSACGCPLCFTIWLAYSEKKHSRGAGSGMEFVSFKFKLLDGSRELDMLRGRSARNIKFHFRAVFSNDPSSREAQQNVAGEDTEEASLVNIVAAPVKGKGRSIQRASSNNTNSKETWSIVTRWFHQCASSHSECGQKGSSGRMPTRVIDVGTPSSPHLRLHIPNAGSSISPYAALSHCWGGLQTVKQLRQTNLRSMTYKIDPNELSRTFRDAITITRRIGLQYLWIDSLCIIQDSFEDWNRESSKMGEVYKNCLVNISATAAPNGDTGCFLQRNPARARTCRVIIERAAKGRMMAKSGVFDLVPKQLCGDSIYKAPLAGRGWVVQEHFLAPRIIHFSQHQLFWECQQLNACEMFPNGIPHYIWSSGSKFQLSYEQRNRLMLNLVKVETELISKSIIDAYSVWIMTIRQYTRCHLTKERDKLVAVSAIAMEIQPIIQDEYLAGLWRRYLPFQLLWFAHHPPDGDRIPTRPKSYCAPSWSWASLNANIEPDLETLKDGKDFMIKVLEARVTTTNSAMYEQVSAGFLRIRGWMRGFYVDHRSRFPWTLVVPGGCLVTAFFDEPQQPGSGLWYCLPIMEGLNYRNHLKITGLILEKTENNNVYRRAGIFQASRRYPGDNRHYEFRRPSYSSHRGKTRERSSEISGTVRRERKRDKGPEVDGGTVTPQLPVFKWDTVGRNLCLGNASREENLQATTHSRDWFFFPDSLPKQDELPVRAMFQDSTDVGEIASPPSIGDRDGARNVHQTPLLDERNLHVAGWSARQTSAQEPSSGTRSRVGAEGSGDKHSNKRQRKDDEADELRQTKRKHPDSADDDTSNSTSYLESSDDSDDDEADDEAVEEQETRMRREWVECIITII